MVASLFLVALVGAAVLSILSPDVSAFDGDRLALPARSAGEPPAVAGTLDQNTSDLVPARFVPVAPVPPPVPVGASVPAGVPGGGPPPVAPQAPTAPEAGPMADPPAAPPPVTDDLSRPSDAAGQGAQPEEAGGGLPQCAVSDPAVAAPCAGDASDPSSGTRHRGGPYRDPDAKGQVWVHRGAAEPAVAVAAPQAPAEGSHLRAAGAVLFLSWIGLRLVPLVMGSRLERDAVRAHPVRRAMLDHLEGHPGETTASLADASGVGCGRATYHLSILVREQLVRVRRIDGRRRFFPAGAPRVADEEVVVRELARPARQTGRIVQILCRAPGATLSELARRLGMSPGQAHYHVAKLDEVGLLYRVRRGRRVRHYLTADGHSLSAKVQVHAVGRGEAEGSVAA